METRLGSQNISALPKQSTKEAAWVQGLSFRAPRQLPQLPTGPAANPTLNHSLPSTREQRCHKHGRFRQCARSSGDSRTLLFFGILTPPDGSQPLTRHYPEITRQRGTPQTQPSVIHLHFRPLAWDGWGGERSVTLLVPRVWALLGSIRLPQSLSCLFRLYFS